MGNNQLTTAKTCQQKHTYHSNAAARRAVKRRNEASGYNYLRKYQCNVCGYWHVTSQDKVNGLVPTDLKATTDSSNSPTEATQERKDILND